MGYVEESLACQKPAQFVQSFRYDTSLWRTDGRTHDDSIYRASIASRGENGNHFALSVKQASSISQVVWRHVLVVTGSFMTNWLLSLEAGSKNDQ